MYQKYTQGCGSNILLKSGSDARPRTGKVSKVQPEAESRSDSGSGVQE